MAAVLAKSKKLTFNLTEEQHRLISERAARCRMSTSAWVRTILMQVTNRQARSGYLRIHEPDGALR